MQQLSPKEFQVTLPEQDQTLRNLLRTFQRRKSTIYITVAVMLALAITLCVVSTRRYQASARIELQKSSADGLGLESMISGGTSGASDALSLNIDLQTQSSILQSDTLALRVIKKLNLEKDKDFTPRFSPIGWVFGLFSPAGTPDPAGASLESSPRLRQRLVATFERNLHVRAVAGTRLIEVAYSSQDPKVAAAVVNSIIQELIDYTFQVRYTATNQTSKWLEGQLNDLRDQSAALQAKVVAMQKSTGLFGVGGTDPSGKPVIYSPAIEQLQNATAALSQAQANRILRGAVYEVTKSGNAELISQLSGTPGATNPGVANSLGLIQTLRAQQATAQAQLDHDSAKFGSAFPRLAEERAALSRIDKALDEEIGRVGDRARNDFEISKQSEAGARNLYDQARISADRLNDKTIEYTILEKEASESQQLYQSLLTRLREAGVLEGLKSSNLTVVDAATPPATPSSPRVPMYLAGGLGFGLFLGLGAALLVDSIDNHVQGAYDIEQMGLPLLGLIPTLEGKSAKSPIPLLDAVHSAHGESIRRLRSTLLLSRSVAPPKVILIASGSPGEGKSTVSLNLAAAFAQLNQKVLLIEGDMRKPVLQRRLSMEPTNGLSQLLSGAEMNPEEAPSAGVANLSLVAAGPTPPYPAELLSSDRFRELVEYWKTEYDVIVIDSPPVLPVSDVQSIAAYADATLLLVRAGSTTRASLQRSVDMLRPHVKANTMGIVLNAVPVKSTAYYEYYGYKQEGYYKA